MRRVVLMVALALALPTAALANSILDYSNSTGTISASDSSLSITSTITTISVLGGTVLQTGLNLGTLSITAGAMTSGSAAAGDLRNVALQAPAEGNRERTTRAAGYGNIGSR